MADAGLLSVKITADDAQLLAALARSRSAVKATSDQMRSGMDVLKSYGAQLAGLGFAAFIHNTSEAIDNQAKLARQVGGTTSAIQTLARAGDLAGVSSEDLSSAAGKLNVKLGQALENTGSATGALKALGLTAEGLSKMDIDERFAAIADAIAGAGITAQQTSSIMKDLGIKQASVISLFEGGGDSIRNARKEIEGFGVAVSEIDAAKIEAGNDAMTSIMLTARGVATQISIQLAPVLQEIGTLFHDAAGQSNGFRDVVIPALEAVAKGVSYVGDSIKGLNMLWLLVKSGAEYMTADVLKLLAMIPLGLSNYVDGAISEINTLIAAANKVANLNIPPIKLTADTEAVQAMRGTIKGVEDQARATEKQLEQMASEDLPSDKVDTFFENVRKRAQEAAVAVVDARKTMTEPVVLDTTPPKEKKESHDKGADTIEAMRTSALSDQAKVLAELQEKYKELNAIIEKNPELQAAAGAAAAALAEQYQAGIDSKIAAGQRDHDAFIQLMAEKAEAIATQNETDLEVQLEKYTLEQEALDEALLNRAISEQTYRDATLASETAHEKAIANMKIKSWDDLAKLNKLSWQSQLKITTATLMDITATLSTHSRAAFEVNKAAAIANATIKGVSGVMSAWDAGMATGGPWAPAIAAGYAIAAGVYAASQISAISSTSFGGGAKSTSGGIPSAATSTPSGGGEGGGAGGGAPSQVLAVQGLDNGALFTGSFVRELSEKLIEHQKDGGKVVFTA